MIIIGITGGIGSGKSTVSNYLIEHGYEVIDADKISREITKDGSPVIDELAEAFGKEILISERVLDRRKLAAIAFSDESKKKLLEQIVTTKIKAISNKKIEDLRNSGKYDIIFCDAPTLFETGGDKNVDKVWLVTADQNIRIARVMARDNVTEEEVLRRIANQLPEEIKIAKSDEIIDNSKGLEELEARIEELLRKYV